MKTTKNENRPGRFANLLSSGAKPRRSFALMMALVLVGMLSLAGVVSADSYFVGLPPETVVNDAVVTGDVDVLYANTWTSPDNVISDSSWANFTLQAPATGKTLKFARLYIVVYSGNSTANFKGNETIKLYNSDTLTTTLADHQPLDLAYDLTGIALNSSVPAPFTTLSRVTSDYLSVFDVKDYVTSNTINVHIMTMNESLDIDTMGVGRFDGRIKEAKIVYGWDDEYSTGMTHYWINEGQDPRTYYGDGTPGTTTFEVPDIGVSSATLYTNDIASANGVYAWNDATVTPTTVAYNSYARLNRFTLDPEAIIGDSSNNLTYNRVGNYYKLALAILKIKIT
jgi:hypothetical protein